MYYQVNIKRKVFISFHQKDKKEVDEFINEFSFFGNVFIPKAIGISDNDDLINSLNPEYVMGQIRKKYLGDSTVTIVLIGSCTHSRRYVDWEIKTSLRRGEFHPNGLIGILLKSQGDRAHLPTRFQENWNSDLKDCYARYYSYPNSSAVLRDWIEDAYNARSSRADFIKNSSDMMKYNALCKVHKVTH